MSPLHHSYYYYTLHSGSYPAITYPRTLLLHTLVHSYKYPRTLVQISSYSDINTLVPCYIYPRTHTLVSCYIYPRTHPRTLVHVPVVHIPSYPVSHNIIISLLYSPERKMQQVLSNPAIMRQIMREHPELAQEPGAQELFSNPDALRSLFGGGSGDEEGRGTITPAIFDQAMLCLNGAPIPAGYPTRTTRNVRHRGVSEPNTPQEFITRVGRFTICKEFYLSCSSLF